MVDVTKPFIRFKAGDDTWILTLKKEEAILWVGYQIFY
jgi:hypothetical protein